MSDLDTELLHELDLLEDEGLIEPEKTSGKPTRYCLKITDGVACTNELPPGARNVQKYCEEHRPLSKHKKVPEGDEPQPARVVNNNFTVKAPAASRGSRKDSEAAKVEAGALAMLVFVPMIWAMVGDDVCPIAFQDSLPAIAHQLGELSKFHPALKKIFAPGEGTGEAMVWVSLAIAASPVIIAVLTHHRLVKGDMAAKLGEVAATMKTLSDAVAAS